MIDPLKQIEYWRSGAEEDWSVGKELLDRGRLRHALFLLHLALEKALKAHICRTTKDLPPRIHNLVRLLEISTLPATQEQRDLLAEMNPFNIEGRYPQTPLTPLSLPEAQSYLNRSEKVYQWLIHQF